MPAITIRGVVLGEGMPKICVPLTDKTITSMRSSLEAMKGQSFDLIEWRADKFEGLRDESALFEAAAVIRETFPETPLLFTIRTNRDMEDFEISDADYRKINTFVMQNHVTDLVDIESSRGEDFLKDMAEEAHRCAVTLIASRHIASSTPSAGEIVDTLVRMQACGADIVKYAAMPTCERDVLNLLDATLTMKEAHADTPFITMSMSRLGVISRLCGGLTGSCLTFGTVGAASAPGQIPCGVLKSFLEAL